MEKIILNLIVTEIDYHNNKVICRVIETDQVRIFDKILFGDNFFDAPEVDDEFIATITEGAGFSEINVVPNTEKESRIVIRKCIHQKKEFDCYLPQIRINDRWYSALEKGSYILKEADNPLIICKSCSGSGFHTCLQTNGALPNYMELISDQSIKCKECNGIGLRKGIATDLKHIAQSFLDKKLKELNDARELINNFTKPKNSLTGKSPEISFNKFNNK